MWSVALSAAQSGSAATGALYEMTQRPEDRSMAGEAMIVSGMAVILGACLFEWLVVSPDHPGHAVLRVLGAGLAATFGVMLAPRR